MKKIISFILLFLLVSCQKQTVSLVLPPVEDIESVLIEDETIKTVTDKVWIQEFTDVIHSAKYLKKSYNDFPNGENVTKIEFMISSGKSGQILYVYSKNGTYYAEQPYNGIYELEASAIESYLNG